MIGKRLAHYEIVELLGKGGMGAVYRARDSRLGRDIALKVLPADLAENREFNRRFELEVKSLAALRHPNIVTVHSFEEADGATFFTMELVAGQALDEQIPARGFASASLFGIVIPVVDAVAHAHAHGITHRDLKPANIMLDPDGTPRVLDFGLAKPDATGSTPDARTIPLDDFQTGEGRILGTVAYMSPEQAEGKPADPRSDIFSLGIILYELATGQRPFTGDTPVSTISSIIKDEPVAITTINQRLPRHLWRIVKKCLEKDPGRRYQSAVDLRNDLEELRGEIESGELAEPTAGVSTDRSGTRRWFGLVLAVIVVGAGWLGYSLLTRDGAPGEAPLDPLGGSVNLTRSGQVRSADLSPDGKLLVYTERIQKLSSLRVLQLSTSSEVEILPPSADELGSVQIGSRGDFVYYLNSDRRVLYRISILGGAPRRLFDDVDEYALAPDGRRLVIMRSFDSQGEMWLGDIVTGELQALAETFIAFSFVCTWSGDGESILYNALRNSGVTERLMQLPLTGGPASPRGSIVWGYIDAMSRLRNGGGLVISAPRFPGPLNIHVPSELWIVPTADREPVRLTFDHFEYASIGSDEPGDRLTALQRQYEHMVWVLAVEDPSNPLQVMYTSRAGKWWLPLTWTRDDRILYPALAGDEVHVWEVGSDGANRRRITSSGSFNLCCSVSPDDRTLVYASNLDGTLKLYLVDREGGVPRRLTDTAGDEFFPDFSPDGQWIVYLVLTDQHSRLRKTSLVDGHSVDLGLSEVYVPTYSPDGSRIACLAADTLIHEYEIAIISADDGRILRSFPGQTMDYARIRWTPDGGALVFGRHHDDVDNLWLQPVDGGEPKQLTRFTSGHIAGFALSASGDSLAVAMMEEMSDVVMFEGYGGKIERAVDRKREN